MSLSDLRIGTRLGGGFAIILALLAVVTGLGVVSMNRIDARMSEIVDNHNVKIASANAIARKFSRHLLCRLQPGAGERPGRRQGTGGKAGRRP